MLIKSKFFKMIYECSLYIPLQTLHFFLCCEICLCHNIAEILLKLALNTNQLFMLIDTTRRRLTWETYCNRYNTFVISKKGYECN
jgi:hypothetical protein